MRVLFILFTAFLLFPLATQAQTEAQKLTASDTEALDRFGTSVALDDDLAVVGAFYENCTVGPACGAAYVFTKQPDGSWAETQKLTAPGAQFFGIDVGITSALTFGDVPRQIVVGSYFDSCSNGDQCGAVYVFDPQPDGSWAQSQRLQASDAGAGDFFGVSLTTGGPWLTIGAPRDDCDAGADCGAAYMFVRGFLGDWNEYQKLTPNDRDAGDEFGSEVNGPGVVFAIGAPHDDCADGEDCGAVYYFARLLDSSFGQIQKVTPSDPEAGALFGFTIEYTATGLVAGAIRQDCDAGADCGAAYVFENQSDGSYGGTFVETQRLAASDADAGDLFGISLALSEDDLVVGAYGDGCADGADCGSGYRFTPQAGGSWGETDKLNASDSDAGDRFGISLALEGEEVLVGAYHDECAGGEQCGSVFVYNLAADPTLALDVRIGRVATAVCTDPADPGSCTLAETTVTASPGEALVVRYTIENLGTIPLTSHDLTDTSVGVLLNNLSFVLEPGAHVSVGDFRTAPEDPDVYTYEAIWTARDEEGMSTQAAATYEVHVELGLNTPPIASAGDDQTVVVGQTVALDGSGSSDPDGDALTYVWVLDGPGGSILSGDDTVSPMFCAAEVGDYTATLVVNDGTGDSAPDEATITAISMDAALDDLADLIAALGPTEGGGDGTLNGGQVNALNQKIRQTRRELERGRPDNAAVHLAALASQLASFVADEVLSEEQAQVLLALIDAIAEATTAPCAPDADAAAPVTSAKTGTPEGFALLTTYPNPLRASATVAFEVPASSFVRLEVFDALGRTVAVLAEGSVEAGRHEALFDARSLPSGAYLVRMTTDGGFAQTRRLTVLR